MQPIGAARITDLSKQRDDVRFFADEKQPERSLFFPQNFSAVRLSILRLSFELKGLKCVKYSYTKVAFDSDIATS